MQKLTFVFRKINKNFCHQSCTVHFLTPICTKSFVGWGFATDLTGGAYSAPRNPSLHLRGLLIKEWGRRERVGSGAEEEWREGVRPLPQEEKKEKSAPMPADDVVMAELVPICSIITR